MPSPFPHLPCEVVDDIVDTALSSCQIHSSGVSSLALVSHRIRQRVSLRRFSNVEIHAQRTPSYRLRILANLLGTKVWSQDEAPQHFIKSFTLLLDATKTSGDSAYSTRHTTIAMILGTIFRCNTSDSKYSLSIVAGGSFSTDNSEMWGLPFNTSLGPKVLSGLKDLCYKSYLTELCLQSVWNVPPSLLHNSKITQLRLSNVHFDLQERQLRRDRLFSPLGDLKHFLISDSTNFTSPASFAEVTQMWKKEYPFGLQVENFEIWARNKNHLATLSKFGVKAVDTLTINMFDFVYPQPGIVDYGHFPEVRCLEINLQLDISPRAPDECDDSEKQEFIRMLQAPAFLSISNLLPPILPPVLRIKLNIQIDWFDTFIASREALDELYHTIYHPSLLQYLGKNGVSGYHQVQIILKIYIFLQKDDMEDDENNREIEFKEYMHQLLESLTSLDIVVLEIDVGVCP